MISVSRTLFVFLLLCFALLGQAQNAFMTKQTAPSKAIKLLEKATDNKYKNKPEKQLKFLNQLTEKYPIFVDAYIAKAFYYYNSGNTEKARQTMEKAVELAPDYEPKNHLIIANYCELLGDLDCEKRYLENYLSYEESKRLKVKLEKRLEDIKVRNELAATYKDVSLEKLSEAINSEDSPEYKPVLSLDGLEMIFTRRVNGQEDFYISKKEDGEWQTASPITNLNTPGNEGAHALSSDGKWMIYTRCDAPKRYRGCDLYISRKVDGAWTPGQYLAITNTDAWESQAAFSPDGNTIYFSSGRNGNKDLYYVERKNKQWTSVQNMGNTINTAANEESPFMHPDGNTLYFMSDGHTGLGGMDLFVTKRNWDGSWTEPLNMGAAINSPKDEGGLFVDLAGEYAYFSKTEKTEKGIDSDIFRFKLPDDFKPDPITFVRFLVRDGETQKPVSATAEIIQLDSAFTKNIYISESGTDEIILQNTDYSINIEKSGYIFHSERINPNQKSNPEEPIIYNIEIFPIESVAEQDTTPPVSLRNITFETGSFTLKKESFNELNKLIKLLGENPKLKILLNGHTDNVGNPEDNVILSQNRVQSVKEYLKNNGIMSDRIDTQAFGESRPIASNENEVGRAMNRRIEFQLINPL